MKYNILTGADTTAQDYKRPIKKMCLNCVSCTCNDEQFFCNNEKVIEAGRKKILEAVPEGFEISVLELKPMQLKNPTKKCGNYDLDVELVKGEIVFELS